MVFFPKISWRVMLFGLERDLQVVTKTSFVNWNVEFIMMMTMMDDGDNFPFSLLPKNKTFLFLLVTLSPLRGIAQWTLDGKKCHSTTISHGYQKNTVKTKQINKNLGKIDNQSLKYVILKLWSLKSYLSKRIQSSLLLSTNAKCTKKTFSQCVGARCVLYISVYYRNKI